MALGLKKVVGSGFEDALVRVPEALKAEGFGVLTEIDVTDTLKKKLKTSGATGSSAPAIRLWRFSAALRASSAPTPVGWPNIL